MASSSHRVLLSPPPVSDSTNNGDAPLEIEKLKNFAEESGMRTGVGDVVSPVLQKRKHVESAEAATPSFAPFLSCSAAIPRLDW